MRHLLPVLLLGACPRNAPPVAAPPGTPTICSTSALRVALPAQDLPPAVAATRERLAGLAAACAYDDLATVARERGGPFTYSFGGGDDPAGYWRELEGTTPDEALAPMEALVRVLALTPCREDLGGVQGWAWPAAACGSPAPAERDELLGMYDAETLAAFEQLGGYAGWRVAITDDGAWRFFVVGD